MVNQVAIFILLIFSALSIKNGKKTPTIIKAYNNNDTNTNKLSDLP